MNATEPSKQGDFSIICCTRARRFNAAQVRVKPLNIISNYKALKPLNNISNY